MNKPGRVRFAAKRDRLRQLANEALEEDARGETRSLDESFSRVKTTRSFWRHFEALPADAQRKALHAYRLFRGNPSHPSLHFKRSWRERSTSTRSARA